MKMNALRILAFCAILAGGMVTMTSCGEKTNEEKAADAVEAGKKEAAAAVESGKKAAEDAKDAASKALKGLTK